MPATRYRSSWLACLSALALALAFLLVTVLHQRGRFAHADLRIVAHIVPVRYHPRLLAAVHPLVHLGDAVFVVPIILLVMILLWLRGYRRWWAALIGILSWPIELGCKALLQEPGGLDPSGSAFNGETVHLGDLVHGPGTGRMVAWFDHAAPGVPRWVSPPPFPAGRPRAALSRLAC